jgi:radical SAM superfamily enzyme YgiQ (UPF0313 family)
VVDEIEQLHATYGFTHFVFYDDELNIHTPRLLELCRELIALQDKLGVKLHFRGFMKAELASVEQFTMLSEAGFDVLVVGAESGSDRILTNMRKHSTVEDNTRFVDLCRQFDIKAKAIMSLGHPGESDSTLEATEQWLDHVMLDDVNFTIISCLPGAPYYDKALRTGKHFTYTALSGDVLYSDDVDFHAELNYVSADLDYGYESTVWTDALDREDLVQWHKYLESRFKERDVFSGQ